MIYRDLLKISIHIIAVKLFVDCVSQIPERIYGSSLAGNWITNVLLYLCLNLLIAFLLFRFSNYLINGIFLKEKLLVSQIFITLRHYFHQVQNF